MDNYGTGAGTARLASIDRDQASASVLLPSIGNPYKNRNEGQKYATIQGIGPIKAL